MMFVLLGYSNLNTRYLWTMNKPSRSDPDVSIQHRYEALFYLYSDLCGSRLKKDLKQSEKEGMIKEKSNRRR